MLYYHFAPPSTVLLHIWLGQKREKIIHLVTRCSILIVCLVPCLLTLTRKIRYLGSRHATRWQRAISHHLDLSLFSKPTSLACESLLQRDATPTDGRVRLSSIFSSLQIAVAKSAILNPPLSATTSTPPTPFAPPSNTVRATCSLHPSPSLTSVTQCKCEKIFKKGTYPNLRLLSNSTTSHLNLTLKNRRFAGVCPPHEPTPTHVSHIVVIFAVGVRRRLFLFTEFTT